MSDKLDGAQNIDPPTSSAEEAPTIALQGKRLGRYEIKHPLGQGGMGQVFFALDTELERSVALKVISPHLAGDEAVLKRFKREARAVARLNHPGIVQIYEFGQDQGVHYFAMEYVEGRTLTQVLAGMGVLSVDQAARLMLNAVNALDYALGQSVIHRDIKPANILISNRGLLKLLDFGLARCLKTDSDLTRSGTVIGSPHYMSPEQGMSEPVDHRSDIYSLGVTLYYMLEGSPPFEAESPLAVMMKQVQEPLPRSEHLKTLAGGIQASA